MQLNAVAVFRYDLLYLQGRSGTPGLRGLSGGPGRRVSPQFEMITYTVL